MLTKNFFKAIVLAISILTIPKLTKAQQDSICCPPDSLRVISAINAQLCVSWKVPDSCNAVVGATLEYRRIPGLWNAITIHYPGGSNVHSYCINVSPCNVKYEWRIRSICGDTLNPYYSAYVSSPAVLVNCNQLTGYGKQQQPENKPSLLYVPPADKKKASKVKAKP